jgi:hypothetical protein
MNELIEKSNIGFFKGFSESGLEFKAEIVSPYNSHYRPILGSFILVFVDKQNLIFGRITRFNPVGIMTGIEGDEYLADLARMKKQDIPEDLKESKLRYNLIVKLLGGIEYDYHNSQFKFHPSIRKLPHLGAPVKEPTFKILNFICSLGSQQTDEKDSKTVTIGHYSIGEQVFNGENSLDELPIQFDIDKLVAKRSFVFARAGYGKSVLIKLLVTKLYEKEQDVGMLIFDPEGEYAFPVKSNLALANIPELADKLVVYTNRKYPNLDEKYRKMIAGKVNLNLTELRPADIVDQCVVEEKQDNIFALRLKGMRGDRWTTLIEKLEKEDYGLEDIQIAELAYLDLKTDKASINAIKNNLVPIIKSLHDSNSRMIEGIKHHLKKGHIIIIDISLLSTGASNEICGLILNEIFNENQRNFSSGEDGQIIKTIVIIEEAQTVLSPKMKETSPFVRWVKEGRKYGLGAILITQQPGAIANELLSQGDNFFAFHLLSEGDLKALQRANAHFSNDILANILNEPIKGNAYFWSAPDQPFILPVRITNFTEYAKGKSSLKFPTKTAVEEFKEIYPALESELFNITKSTLEENLNLFIFSNITLDGKKIENHFCFSHLHLRLLVAESLSSEAVDQFVEITKNGKKLVKIKNFDDVLKKLGISQVRYLDETDYDYLLLKNDTINLKKERESKQKFLRSQKNTVTIQLPPV